MKSKIVISSSNNKVIEALKHLQKKKRELQQIMAQDKPLSILKINRV